MSTEPSCATTDEVPWYDEEVLRNSAELKHCMGLLPGQHSRINSSASDHDLGAKSAKTGGSSLRCSSVIPLMFLEKNTVHLASHWVALVDDLQRVVGEVQLSVAVVEFPFPHTAQTILDDLAEVSCIVAGTAYEVTQDVVKKKFSLFG